MSFSACVMYYILYLLVLLYSFFHFAYYYKINKIKTSRRYIFTKQLHIAVYGISAFNDETNIWDFFATCSHVDLLNSLII